MKEKELLKQEPTIERWRLELRRLLYGDRAQDLIALGGIQEYIEVTLRDSSERAVAKTAFDEALRLIVQAWQPIRPEPKRYAEYMLDLIGAYTPPEGFTKVLGVIRQWGRFDACIIKREGLQRDLHMKALIVLGNYYAAPAPSAPTASSKDYGFIAYVEVLREHLHNSAYEKYKGYAGLRLMELGILEPDDDEITDFIYRNPQRLGELMPLWLNPNRLHRAGRDLKQVYAYCLGRGIYYEGQFAAAIEKCGAKLERREDVPIVILGPERIYLTLSEEEQYRYLAYLDDRNLEALSEYVKRVGA
ncbi:MAG TPA: hypothetical protein VKA70_12680 [Blastocatellia bacterium]|nr:hypothetical protein [Blastocatellia bacterium]